MSSTISYGGDYFPRPSGMSPPTTLANAGTKKKGGERELASSPPSGGAWQWWVSAWGLWLRVSLYTFM